MTKDQVLAFRAAAVRDGWDTVGTYDNGLPWGESAERASTHHKDDFAMIVLARPSDGRSRDEYEIYIWGPDGLAINVPETYSMEALRAGLSTCSECGARDVHIQKVGFANRCCDACLDDARRRYEKPGWAD